MKLVLSVLLSAGMLLATGCSSHHGDQGAPGTDESKTLRIITWSDYIPQEIVDQFRQETGIQVEVSLSNNEEIISKLRATGGAG
ncbi:MAG: spermidine/putrescine ABC transporter substrate-binding protein, partial [Gammaproteobacteria bacterium]|nr:spermidine/putrescine ABC transporter substrate-binding protein [Gammaproteobacteria bacterium]